MLCPYTSFHYSQFFARFVQKAVIHDVHRVDRLGHFGAFAREIDQNLNGFRFDVRVLSEERPTCRAISAAILRSFTFHCFIRILVTASALLLSHINCRPRSVARTIR